MDFNHKIPAYLAPVVGAFFLPFLFLFYISTQIVSLVQPLPLWGWLFFLMMPVLSISLAFLVYLWLLEKKRYQQLRLKFNHVEQSEKKYRDFFDSIPSGLQEIDTKGNILFSNRAEHMIRRYRHGELIGKSVIDMFAVEGVRAKMRHNLVVWTTEQPEQRPFYEKVLRKNEEVVELRMSWSYKRDVEGKVIGFFAITDDVSETHRVREKILDKHLDLIKLVDQRAADLIEAYNDLLMASVVFENTTEAILITDLYGYMQTVNPAFTQVCGYTSEDVLGRSLAVLASQKRAKGFYKKLWQYLKKHDKWQGELWHRHKDGSEYPAWLSVTAVKNVDDVVIQYVVIIVNIRKRKQYERKIWHQAHYDTLTALPNRKLFYKRVEKLLAQEAKHIKPFALMFIDLDHFKEVNDTLGHDAGDELLVMAGQRLVNSVGKQDTIARMGGDEFTVIVTSVQEKQALVDIARTINQAMMTPFELSLKTVSISASIGVVMYPEHGEDLSMLLKNADIAMYQVKEKSRNDFGFFTPEAESD